MKGSSASKRNLVKPKVGIFLNTELSAGGGHHEEINLFRDLVDELQDKYDLKVVTFNSQRKHEFFGIQVIRLKKYNISNFIYLMLKSSLLGLFLMRFLNSISGFEKQLKSHNLNYIFFPSPSWRAALLRDLNFAFTLWDTSHRQSPEFTEVRSDFSISIRDFLYKIILPWASTILVDSKESLKNIIHYYGAEKSKCIILPFSPSKLIAANDSKTCSAELPTNNKYILYPAQFWQHKNHHNLLRGFEIALQSLQDVELIFTGSDKGQMRDVKSIAKQCGILNNVKFLGFVDNLTLLNLYQHSLMVIFPSFFGVTNLIPLEAWQFKTPLVCSDIFKSQVGEAAILFDPHSPKSISEAIIQAAQDDKRSILIKKGTEALSAYKKQRFNSIKKISLMINECFKKLDVYNTYDEK